MITCGTQSLSKTHLTFNRISLNQLEQIKMFTIGYLSLPFLTFPFLSFPYLSPFHTFSYISLPSFLFLTFQYLSLHFLTFPYLSLTFLTFSYLYMALQGLTNPFLHLRTNKITDRLTDVNYDLKFRSQRGGKIFYLKNL